MQRIQRFIAVLIITGLTLCTPGLALSEFDINVDLWSHVSGNKVSAWRFAAFGSDNDTNQYVDNEAAPATEIGYWFEDIPWIGITSETSLSTTNEGSLETTRDADTDFDPLNSFILFRSPDGPFQPFVGVGPTLLVSDFASKNIHSFQHIFMGLQYTF